MDPSSAPVRDRTDRCPGVLRLHDAADGALARVRLPGGRISRDGLAAVADVAALGNGLVDLTSRASLQIRGLDRERAPDIAERLRCGGLLPSLVHDRVRNVLASPLAGRHPRSLTAVDALLGALDRELCADAALARLPGRFLFAVEDGSDAIAWERADVALVAEAPAPDRVPRAGAEQGLVAEAPAPDRVPGAGAEQAFRLWLAGTRTTLWACEPDAPRLALDAARAFLARSGGADVGAWRISAVVDGRARIASGLGGALEPLAAVSATPLAHELTTALEGRVARLRRRALDAGELTQPDGRRALTVLPALGRLDSAALAALAALVTEVRLSAARTLTIVDVPAASAAPLARELSALGLIVSARSGWQGLTACAGLGACGRARVDVRAAATARARVRGAAAAAEHWSACERGCGRPSGVALSVTATDNGLCVDVPGGARTVADVASALASLAART